MIRLGCLIFFNDFLGVDRLIFDRIELTLAVEVLEDLKNVGEFDPRLVVELD